MFEAVWPLWKMQKLSLGNKKKKIYHSEQWMEGTDTMGFLADMLNWGGGGGGGGGVRMCRECWECFPHHRLQRKPLVSDPGMPCVTHVLWCILGSLACSGRENVASIPGACTTCNFAYLVRGPLNLPFWCWDWNIPQEQGQYDHDTGLILGLCSANERRRYFVTTSLIGWVQA